MKKTVILICSMLFSVTTFAQTGFRFADSTAQWQHKGSTDDIPDYRYVYYPIGDTVINGMFYQGIKEIATKGINDSGVFYLRRDSLDRIYGYRRGSGEYLLFDFGKNKGDTIWNFHYGKDAAIDSVDTVFMLYPRTRVFYHYTCDSIKYLHSWIDGIGSTYTGISGDLIVCGLGWFDPYYMTCFYENKQLLIANSINEECNYFTGVMNEIIESDKMQIYPNPATNQLSIQTTNFQPQTLSIFDMSGRKVMEEKYSPEIDISALQAGGYFIELRNEETVVRKRWVKGN